MFVSSGTRRMWPLRNVGPLTDEYSLTSDWDNQWLTGGLEADVIAEAHLDQDSIVAGIQRFAGERAAAPRRAARAAGGAGIAGIRSGTRHAGPSPSEAQLSGVLQQLLDG